MVCFSHHTYETTPQTCQADIARLRFFYGDELNVQELTITPQNGDPVTFKNVKSKSILERLQSSAGWTKCVVDLGRQWTGLTQSVLIPHVPEKYLTDVKANEQFNDALLNRICQLDQKVTTPNSNDASTEMKSFQIMYQNLCKTYSSIKTHTESGHDTMQGHSLVSLTIEELHMIARGLILDYKIKQAFYDRCKQVYCFLVAGHIVHFSTQGLYRAHDIDFDLDDGFFGDAFQNETYYDDWNKTYFQPWKSQSRPARSPFPELNVVVLTTYNNGNHVNNNDRTTTTTTTTTKEVLNEVQDVKQEVIVSASKLKNDWQFPLVYVCYQSVNKVGSPSHNDAEMEQLVKLFQKMAKDAGFETASRFDPVLTADNPMSYHLGRYDQTFWTVCITNNTSDKPVMGSYGMSELINMMEANMVDKQNKFSQFSEFHCPSVPEGTRVYRILKDEFAKRAAYFISGPLKQLKEAVLAERDEFLRKKIHRS